MPTETVTLRLDSDLLTKARALAEQREKSVEDLILALVTDAVRDHRRREIEFEMRRFQGERPTVSLHVQPSEDVEEESDPEA